MTREEQMMALARSAESNSRTIDLSKKQVFMSAYIQGWRAADSHPHWIPVEERLPEEGQVVLIHTKGGSVSTACYTDSRFDITELFQAINVTHWMEIVPPRKEE